MMAIFRSENRVLQINLRATDGFRRSDHFYARLPNAREGRDDGER